MNSPNMKLYETNMKFAPNLSFLTLSEAHELVGHANDQKIINTSKSVIGLDIVNDKECSNRCEICISSNLTMK